MPFLLDNDLVANIALGMDRNYDLKKIFKILKIVELEDFIKDINDKSFSRIGERGSLISGGQKQKNSNC